MSIDTGSSPYILPCEKCSRWIEIFIRDEFNKPFSGVSGTLTDAAANEFNVTLGEEPIFIEGLAPGSVLLHLDSEEWLIESQQNEHKPNNDTKPTSDFADEYVNDQGDKAIFVNVTAGDLTELVEGQTLPPRHEKGQADSLRLITDNSYVLQVRGFNFITLRVGMFFDGTANNTYSAQWGKKELDKYYYKWRPKYEVNKHKPVTQWPEELFKYPKNDKFHFFWEEDYAVDGSASNELTNIQKLHDLYLRDVYLEDERVFVHPEYVTGIGTGNETDNTRPADESVRIGQGMGLGKYGVEAKVEQCIEQLCRSLKEIRFTEGYQKSKAEGISNIELDVFGFSRGAAAARHFVNIVVDGEKGSFSSQFLKACKANKIALKAGFDWGKNDSCCIKFVGLFDTVAAIIDPFNGDFTPHNDDNGDVRLWLEPSRIDKVVHLTAHKKTEYRYNFCLNKVNPNNKFEEYTVPGAHSDIGGGYQSSMAYATLGDHKQGRYLLPLLESKPIKRMTSVLGSKSYDEVEASLEEKLNKIIEHEAHLGWKKDDYTIDYKLVSQGKNDKVNLEGTLYKKRIVEGDLSRLYLRIMFGFAENYKVPLDDKSGAIWTGEGDGLYSVPSQIGNYDFADLCRKALCEAKEGKLLQVLNVHGIEDVKDSSIMSKLMQANLIHHSSDRTIANIPHKVGSTYARKVFECTQES